ncbi:terminase [Mycobacterium phage Bonray]|nr:terminase [Mycobacterium phage Bonray]
MALKRDDDNLPNFRPLDSFREAVRNGRPWDSIVDFVVHPSFCGRMLYPRQMTLLKLIYLETETMTDYDLTVIGEWADGFKNRAQPIGVQPDIMDRVKLLKSLGYTHFPHIQMVLGRRASKGIMGGIVTTERIAYLYSLGSWQQHYNQVPGQVAEIQVVAPSLNLSVTRQFKDIRNTVMDCKYLREHIVGDKITEFFIRTPGDEQTIIENKLSGVDSDREIASIVCKAATATSTSGRGGTGFVNCYDEYAHMLTGTGSAKTGEEIYDAFQPALDQFGKDAMTYLASSPYCLAPDTRVLTEDLRWVPVGSVRAGDRLVGFDEHIPGGKGSYRAWRQSIVLSAQEIQAPRYEIVTESGKRIVSTGAHTWLSRKPAAKGRGKNRGSGALTPILRWWRTDELRPGDEIKTMGVDPWETDESREAGYLAGFMDGEGHLSGQTGCSTGVSSLGYAQNHGAVADTVEKLIRDRGYDLASYPHQAGKLGHYRIAGGFPEVLRFLGTIRPVRLLEKFPEKFYGGRISVGRDKGIDRVVSVTPVEDGPVVALETSTKTLVAEGLLTHNSKIGKFYELYQQGSVTLPEYNAREGKLETTSFAERAASQDIDEEEASATVAEPTFLIVQLPSWELYKDYDKSHQIPMLPGKRRTFPHWPGPIQYKPDPKGTPDERVQERRRLRNPDKFKVERGGQFATVQDAYLDENKVDQMFLPPSWRDPLFPQDRGKLSMLYRAHADPSRTNANFGFCIAHLEDAPPDEHGYVWPHVIIDVLKVWKPEDFPDHTLDYVQVTEELDNYLTRFPTIEKMSYDQFNSAGLISHQKRKFSNIRILQQTFTEQQNQDRFEKFKSALNLGWVHCYRDDFAEDGQSLLELELKFLQEKISGSKIKVDKQDIGPVQTKDLADCVMVVVTDLLHASLDRWYASLSKMSGGSTNAAGLKSGREMERHSIFQANQAEHRAATATMDPMSRYFADQAAREERKAERAAQNRATLERNKLSRAQRNMGYGAPPGRTRGRFQ